MRALIVFSCLAFAAARPEAGYSYQRPGGSGGISSGIGGSSFGGGHGGGGGGGGSFGHGGSFSSGGSSSLSFGSGGVWLFWCFFFCLVFVTRVVENERESTRTKSKTQEGKIYKNRKQKRIAKSEK